MHDRSYKPFLLKLLSQTNLTDFPGEITKTMEALGTSELAHAFVDVAFLVSAIRFVGEERWVQTQNATKEVVFGKFIKKLFKAELSPVLFMHDFLEESSLEGIKQSSENAIAIEIAVVKLIKTKPSAEQTLFARTALRLMSDLFEFEHQLVLSKQELGLHLGMSLYRTFDRLDEIFNLNYLADKDMISPLENKERLYEGAGIGVQSGYSSALIALRYLNLPKGSRFIDLGAGYGRVGIVVGLMRPDVEFLGYEYVPHRVKIAQAACLNLGISDHVTFNIQDLSASDFHIPIAETYYIYDAFSDETYKHVLGQLAAIGSKKNITVVTKGNARQWLEHPDQKHNWSAPQQFDNGNLCFFRS